MRSLPKGEYIGFDWIRHKVLESAIPALKAVVNDQWRGPPNPVNRVWHFRQTLKWTGGPLLSWGHPSEICLVDLPSQVLAQMNGNERVQWLRRLCDLGATPTRLDVAIDFMNASLPLGRQAELACRRGELCGLRTWRRHHEYDAHGRQIRFELSLGSRYSPKYVRIYDKGLEQQNSKRGRHERLEVEFKKGHAIAVNRAVLEAGPDWPIALARMVFGAFDFRVRNGRTELKRRPRAAWYESILAGLQPAPLKKQTAPSSFDTWHSGLARSYLPQLLALAEATGARLGSLIEALATDVTPSRNTAKTAELLVGLGDQPEVIEQAKRT